MLKTQITGAKYLSPQTNQMTNLNIAVPADSKDTEFGTSDILLAKDVIKLGENSSQIQAIKENIDNINNTLNNVNSDMQELKNKVSKINTELFKIVDELPEAATADKGKIYCVKSTFDSSEQPIEPLNAVTLKETYNTKVKAARAQMPQDILNRYTEYIAIEETVDGAKVWNWEKIGTSLSIIS